MFVKVIGVVGLLFFLTKAEANNCPKCGGKVRSRAIFDDDVLEKCVSHSVIHPQEIQEPPQNLPLYGSSFEGPCFRQKTVVKPAIVPPPTYLEPDCKNRISTNSADLAAAAAAAARMLTELTNSNYLNPVPVNLGPAIDISKAYHQALAAVKPSIPADPVSLALAYKTYQDGLNKKVCEDGLTYGFRKLPLETIKPEQPATSTVSEASLYAINNPIVELNLDPDESSGESPSTEAMDELVDLACETPINDMNYAHRPSLADLGYTPAKITKHTFIDIAPFPELPEPVVSESQVTPDSSSPCTSTETSEMFSSNESSESIASETHTLDSAVPEVIPSSSSTEDIASPEPLEIPAPINCSTETV